MKNEVEEMVGWCGGYGRGRDLFNEGEMRDASFYVWYGTAAEEAKLAAGALIALIILF